MDRKIIPAAVAIVVMLAIIIAGLFFVFNGEEDYKSVENLSSRMAIADGERQDPDDNKTDAYRNADSRFGRRTAEELMDSIQDDITMPTTDEAEAGNAYAAPVSDASSVPARPTAKDYHDAMLAGADATYASEQSRPAPRRSGGGSSSRPMTQKERDDKVRHDYELASEIAGRMYGTDGQGTAQGSVQSSSETMERITVPSSSGRSSSDISSLGSDWTAGGMSTLDSSPVASLQEEDRPYRCMFVREEKVKSGQRVTLRVLEDMVIDGVLIPANSHISATCSIKDRLLVSVTSYESNGRIHSVNMEGYDNDGALGIYCPNVNSSAAKTAKNDALSLGHSVIGGSVGSIATGILRTGVSIAKNAGSGEPSVSIPAGYTFYIMKQKKR